MTCDYTKTTELCALKRVNFMVCELHLQKRREKGEGPTLLQSQLPQCSELSSSSDTG